MSHAGVEKMAASEIGDTRKKSSHPHVSVETNPKEPKLFDRSLKIRSSNRGWKKKSTCRFLLQKKTKPKKKRQTLEREKKQR